MAHFPNLNNFSGLCNKRNKMNYHNTNSHKTLRMKFENHPAQDFE